MQQRFRRSQEGVASYFAASVALTPEDLSEKKLRVDVLLFGACDVQMEAEYLGMAARARGLDLHVVATFPDDTHPPITYPFAITAGSHNAAAMKFLDYLKSPEAREIFKGQGFGVAP